MFLRLSFFLGIAVSMSCHFALAALFPPEEHVLSGGDIAGEVALGQTFANLAEGVLDGEAKPAELKPLEAARAEALKPVEAAEAVQAEVKPLDATEASAAVSKPVAALTAQAVPADLSHATQAEPLEAQLPTVTPSVLQAAPVKTAAVARDVIKAVEPEKPKPIKAVEPVKKAAPKKPEPKKTVAKAKPAPKGNAKVTAAAGKDTGKAGAKQAEATQAKKTTAKRAGQAAENSYKSHVLRRVARSASRERAGGSSGTVRLDLRVAPSGALSGVSLAAKSGNARVDQAAVRAAKKAGPFGATPTGKSIILRVQVNVKG